jgi:glutathione-specific gamma-glutamylcyclotransferase
MALTRELLRDGWLQKLIVASGHPVRALTEEELRASRERILAEHPAGEDLELFAYGSLIWNPAFHFRRREIARVHGFHRRFCLWTHLGRGTSERPGLMLGLDSGGSCRGVLYRIAAEDIEGELDIVWRREMVTGAYRPCWVTAHAASGRRRAVTFLINHAHERYAGRLEDEAVVEAVAHACGPLGACADYLFTTTAHLEQLGIADRSLRRLCRAVRARQAAGTKEAAPLPAATSPPA